MLDADKWFITKHAAGRALDMQLSAEDIEALLEHPDSIHESPTYHGRHNLRRGDIAAGVSFVDTPARVVTFVWSNAEAWERDFALAGYDDRRLRTREAFGKSQCRT